MGKGGNFQLPDSSTATTTAILDMVLSYIELSIQITYV